MPTMIKRLLNTPEFPNSLLIDTKNVGKYMRYPGLRAKANPIIMDARFNFLMTMKTMLKMT